MIALGGVAWALVTGRTIAALLAGWFGFANLQSLLAGHDTWTVEG